jgi:hypothetical protein
LIRNKRTGSNRECEFVFDLWAAKNQLRYDCVWEWPMSEIKMDLILICAHIKKKVLTKSDLRKFALKKAWVGLY